VDTKIALEQSETYYKGSKTVRGRKIRRERDEAIEEANVFNVLSEGTANVSRTCSGWGEPSPFSIPSAIGQNVERNEKEPMEDVRRVF